MGDEVDILFWKFISIISVLVLMEGCGIRDGL